MVFMGELVSDLASIGEAAWNAPSVEVFVSEYGTKAMIEAHQFLSIFLIEVLTPGLFVYFASSGFLYYFECYKQKQEWALIRPSWKQIFHEIYTSFYAVVTGAVPTAVFHYLMYKGYTKVYFDINEHGIAMTLLYSAMFLAFTEFFVYWVHRLSHHPNTYLMLHKEHHLYQVPTPWSGMAFNPVDAYGQLLPHLLFPYIFPVWYGHYVIDSLYLGLWAAMIHDNRAWLSSDKDPLVLRSMPGFVRSFFEFVVNGSTHHSVHHIVDYNHGQWTTIPDRLFSTHWDPVKYFEKKEGQRVRIFNNRHGLLNGLDE